jgi:hypothetical protein
MRHLMRSAALIDTWFEMLPPGQQGVARTVHDTVRAVGPGLGREVKWGNLLFTLDGVHALAIAPHKTHLHLQVFRGFALIGRFPQLEGTGKSPRHLKWRYSQPIDQELIAALVRATVELMVQYPRPRPQAMGGDREGG